MVLEPNPSIHRRFQEPVIEDLKRKESGSTADVIEMHVKNYKDTMITLSDLARLTALSPEEVEQDIEELKEQGLIRTYALKKDTYVWHAGAAKEAEETLLNALKKV